MLKSVSPELWAFDAEWVPDPASGRAAYALPVSMRDDEVVDEMWRRGGATESEPRPYLKTVLCRIVSIAFVRRRVADDGTVTLSLHSLPTSSDDPGDERAILQRFLSLIHEKQPQLVGYNSRSADAMILVQRGLAHAIVAPGFARRPDKPWNGMDYFTNHSEAHVDLRDIVSAWGRGTPTLNEIARVCGIPGKLDVDGTSVVSLWNDGDWRSIVRYNECDALTTYLLWLRAALMSGFVSPDEFAAEEGQLEALLTERASDPEHPHAATFLDAWTARPGLRG
jgi:predicted PolB exonuclease-like 3'-5' exonuclease